MEITGRWVYRYVCYLACYLAWVGWYFSLFCFWCFRGGENVVWVRFGELNRPKGAKEQDVVFCHPPPPGGKEKNDSRASGQPFFYYCKKTKRTTRLLQSRNNSTHANRRCVCHSLGRNLVQALGTIQVFAFVRRIVHIVVKAKFRCSIQDGNTSGASYPLAHTLDI